MGNKKVLPNGRTSGKNGLFWEFLGNGQKIRGKNAGNKAILPSYIISNPLLTGKSGGIFTSVAFGPSAVLADVAASLEDQLRAALRAGIDDFPVRFFFLFVIMRLLRKTLELSLDIFVHIAEGVAHGHRAAAAFARILETRVAYRIGRAGSAAVELVDDVLDGDAAACCQGDHAGEPDHEVVAAAGGAFA